MQTFEDFVETSRQALSVDELKAVLERTFADEGYQNYAIVSLLGRSKIGRLKICNLPPGVHETYQAEQWERADPLLPVAVRANRPFAWEDVWRRTNLSKEQTAVVEGFGRLGLHKGITFPLYFARGPYHVMTLSKRQDDDQDIERLPLLHALCTQAWSRYLELNEGIADSSTSLSPREIDILHWMKEGKSNWEIAEISNLSVKTIEYHVSNVLKKMGASNRITAVVNALRLGMLEL